MRQEIQDLEKAIARQDPPLAPHTRAIADDIGCLLDDVRDSKK